MATDKLVSYVHLDKGRVDEEFTDVKSLACVQNPDGQGSTLIVRHSNEEENTTRERVDHLIGFEPAG